MSNAILFMKKIISFIKKQREKNGLSQEYLAKKLHISRPTYAQIEKEKKELSISQAKTLASLFNIAIESFIVGDNQNEIIVKLEKNIKIITKKKTQLRINIPQKKVDKFKEVLLYILKKVGAKHNVGETVIYKLLYFIDFDFYEKFEEQLMGAVYIKNHYGPTPVEFKAITDDMVKKQELIKIKNKHFQYEQKKYLPLKNPDLSKLTAEEIKHIDEVLTRLSDKNAKELSAYSHDDVPWITAQDGKQIEYESVFYRSNKTSVRHYGK